MLCVLGHAIGLCVHWDRFSERGGVGVVSVLKVGTWHVHP